VEVFAGGDGEEGDGGGIVGSGHGYLLRRGILLLSGGLWGCR
jgi:hypothetical protein